MTNRGTRVVVAMVAIPVAGIAAFYAVGTAAGLRLAGTGAGLADAATVALLAVGAFAVAGIVVGILAWRLPGRLLGPALAGILVAAALVTWWTVTARRELRRPAAATVPVAQPIAVRGGDSLVAMLELGTPSDGTGLLPEPLDLRSAPDTAADILVTVTRWSDLESAETGYEQPAISVFRLAEPWFLVATRDSVLGWLRRPDGATVTGLAALLTDRLSYLTAAWDGRLHDEPGDAGHAVSGLVLDHGEPSVRVKEIRRVAGTQWVQVEVHRRSPCEGTGDPAVLATGWVPMWARAQPTVWYYSRGC